MASFNKIIQIPLDPELLAELDEASRKLKSSRSALIRQACRDWLRRLREASLDDEYEAAYRRVPEEAAVGEMQVSLLPEVLPEESW